MKFKLKNHRWYPIIFMLAASAATVFILRSDWVPDGKRLETLLSVLGVIAGSVHFFYSQHLSQTQFFHSLFSDFNKRYDRLNGRLEKIHFRCGTKQLCDLKADETDTLYDYFNLCAEEHLYFDAGYIDKKVWSAWLEGMAFYYNVPTIGQLWEKDFESNKSYYDFDLKEVRRIAKIRVYAHTNKQVTDTQG